MMRKLICGILALGALCISHAAAQSPFPQTLPANTVWGRLGVSPGPAQAIPFTTLFGIADSQIHVFTQDIWFRSAAAVNQGGLFRDRATTATTTYGLPCGGRELDMNTAAAGNFGSFLQAIYTCYNWDRTSANIGNYGNNGVAVTDDSDVTFRASNFYITSQNLLRAGKPTYTVNVTAGVIQSLVYVSGTISGYVSGQSVGYQIYTYSAVTGSPVSISGTFTACTGNNVPAGVGCTAAGTLPTTITAGFPIGTSFTNGTPCASSCPSVYVDLPAPTGTGLLLDAGPFFGLARDTGNYYPLAGTLLGFFQWGAKTVSSGATGPFINYAYQTVQITDPDITHPGAKMYLAVVPGTGSNSPQNVVSIGPLGFATYGSNDPGANKIATDTIVANHFSTTSTPTYGIDITAAGNLAVMSMKQTTAAASSSIVLTNSANHSVALQAIGPSVAGGERGVMLVGGVEVISFDITGTGSATFKPGSVTVGVATVSQGAIAIAGLTSGGVVLTTAAIAGSPTVTFGNTSGTPAVVASPPLAINTTTGNITCGTCLTSASGGALSGTAPIALSAGGAISITGAAGQVLAGASPAFTATPTLGASGTLGSIAFGNATSGLITLRPVTGALGSVTLSMPAATDTLVGKATTDTLTNKTFDTAGTGNVFKINGLGLSDISGTGKVVLDTMPLLATATLSSPQITGTVGGTNVIALTVLNTIAANTMLGNWTGSTANVTANTMISCPDTTGNHLNYVSGTGITCGTSAPSNRQLFTGNSGGSALAFACLPGTTCYFWTGGQSTTEAFIQTPLSIAGTLKRLAVRSVLAPGGTDTFIITVKINGSSSGITCTITGAAQTCNDTTHTAAVAAFDLVSVSGAVSATAANGFWNWSVEYDNP